MSRKMNIYFGLGIIALCIPSFALTALPALQEEGFVGTETCVECHDDQLEKVKVNIHGRLGEHEWDVENSCENCHGPGETHAFSDGEDPVPYPFNEETSAKDVRATCATCHVGGKTMGWHSSEHSSSGVTCLDCHDPKAPYKRRNAIEQTKLCVQCHTDQVTQFHLPSHHPVYEGKMACLDCHNPHSGEETMLKEDTVNDLCLSCHADKHGPFIYEHEPVMEDCLICHTAKGAVQNNLLRANEASLCLRCHSAHEDVHPSRALGGTGGRPAFLTKCTQCHSQIHGSDLPGFSGPSRFIR